MNDKTQIRLERELRKKGYQYIRKRQTKAEAKKAKSSALRFQLTKFDLAMAVAASVEDPSVPLQGKEALFGERYYKKIFPAVDPSGHELNYGDEGVIQDFLAKFWLMKKVLQECRGDKVSAYAKWFAIHDLWHNFIGKLSNRQMMLFVRVSESGRTVAEIDAEIKRSLKAAGTFYWKNRSENGIIIDRQSFFKRSGRYRSFAVTRDKYGSNKSMIERYHQALVDALDKTES